LDALGGVNEQDSAFAGSERAADFVAEVDVAGGVNQVEYILVAVIGFEEHAYRV
jgi:hypothetical protein